MILIDNYDSFTYNIVQYLRELGVNPIIFENDGITVNELRKMTFDSIILSPGAGNPDGAGISLEVIKEFYKTKKILGVCLGHQCIAQFFGAKIIKAKEPCHGKTAKIRHGSFVLFKDIPEEFEVTRYHSLIVKDLSEDLTVSAQTSDGIIMALEHKLYPVFGVQFHPEAILTQFGHKLFQNFIDA